MKINLTVTLKVTREPKPTTEPPAEYSELGSSVDHVEPRPIGFQLPTHLEDD